MTWFPNSGPTRSGALRVLLPILLLTLLAVACGREQRQEDSLAEAVRAYDQGLYLQAESLYEEFLQKNPTDPRRWQAWTRLLDIVGIIRGDTEKAQAILEAMLLEFGSEPERARAVLIRKGDLHRGEGQINQAVEAWLKAQRLQERQADPCVLALRFSGAYVSLGYFDLAQDALRECLTSAQEPGCRVRCRIELAQTYALLDNWTQAAELLEEAVASDPLSREDRSVAIFLLAEAVQHLGQTERARELLTSILDTHPNPMAVQAKLDQIK